MTKTSASRCLVGEGVSPGIGYGRIWRGGADLTDGADYTPGAQAEEKARLHAAAQNAAKQMRERSESLRGQGEQAAADIMEAHALLAEDPLLLGAVEKELTVQGDDANAPKAVHTASEAQAAVLAALEDPYIRERAADVRSVGKALVKALLGKEEAPPPDGTLILAGDDAAPAAFDALSPARIGGMIFIRGSRTSHAAILARAKGIPAVTGLGETLGEAAEGELVIVDGNAGRVTIAPSAAELEAAKNAVRQWQEKCHAVAALASETTVTTDGCLVTLCGNVGSIADVAAAMAAGADSIGLLRSEFLFRSRETFPTEEEQYAAYRDAVEAARGRCCVIRTLDAGADKSIPALHLPAEANPALGQRAIRLCLARPALLKSQLRAILRAGSAGAVGILLPLVVNREEIVAVKEILAEVKEDLAASHIPYAGHAPLGLTVETPAAAIMSERLAKEVDFFSIGTNDLTQYTLAADRTNPAADALGSYFHPAVLRLIEQTAKAGEAAGIPVTICGEMASDPLALPLILGMGIKILSMDAASLLWIRAAVHRLSRKKARHLWEHVKTMGDAADIRAYVAAEMEQDA